MFIYNTTTHSIFVLSVRLHTLFVYLQYNYTIYLFIYSQLPILFLYLQYDYTFYLFIYSTTTHSICLFTVRLHLRLDHVKAKGSSGSSWHHHRHHLSRRRRHRGNLSMNKRTIPQNCDEQKNNFREISMNKIRIVSEFL